MHIFFFFFFLSEKFRISSRWWFALLFTCVRIHLFLIHLLSAHFWKIFSGSPVLGCSLMATVRNRLFWKRHEILWMHCEEQARCDLSDECWTQQRQQNKYKHLWDVWMQPKEISGSSSCLRRSYFYFLFHPTGPSITLSRCISAQFPRQELLYIYF